MEDWGHVTIAREVVRGDDSSVEKYNTRAEGSKEIKKDQK